LPDELWFAFVALCGKITNKKAGRLFTTEMSSARQNPPTEGISAYQNKKIREEKISDNNPDES
jgi:hypothetical protein